MRRSARATAVGFAWKTVALVSGPVAIGASLYFGSEALAMNGYLRANGGCTVTHAVNNLPVYRCALNQSPWQFLIALVLALVGLRMTYVGLRMAVALGRRHRARRSLPHGFVRGRVAMRQFVLATAVGSARQMLALVVAVLAIGGAGYLRSHPLSNSYGACPRQHQSTLNLYLCEQPTRGGWQIPVAVLLGLGGLGSAVVIAGRSRPQRGLADGVSQDRLARI
jgi:hypothetical protein